MRNTPTDLELLDHIYETYYQDFLNFIPEKPSRVARIHVPLDLQKIATHFKTDINIIFGRLYYDLNHKYSYRDSGGLPVKLFNPEVHGTIPGEKEGTSIPKKDIDCVQFLYFVLAGLRDEDNKYSTMKIISWVSAATAVISLLISIIALARS